MCEKYEYGEREYWLKRYKNDGLTLAKFVEQNPIYKKDAEMMITAIKTYAYSFLISDETLRNDRKFCLEALKLQPYIFRWLKVKWRKDDEFIKIALSNPIYSTINYKFLKKHLRNTKEYALMALDNLHSVKDYYIYPNLCEKLRKDLDICKITCKTSRYFQWLCNRHVSKVTTELCEAMFAISPSMVSQFPKKFITVDMYKRILSTNEKCIKDVPRQFRKELITSEELAIGSIVLAEDIKYVPEEFKTEKFFENYINFLKEQYKYSRYLVECLRYIPIMYIDDIINEAFETISHLWVNSEIRSIVENLNDEVKIYLLLKNKKFGQFFNDNHLFLKVMKINPDIREFISDENFADALLEAYLLETLDTFELDYPEFFVISEYS